MMDFDAYIKVYEDYFWVWEEDGDVVSIREGSTIGYTEFLLQIIENLSEQGLPPFGALLLAMTGTNQTMDDSLKRIENIILHSIDHDKYNEEGIKEVLHQAISFLTSLSELPREYAEGYKRIHLFQVLFANCHKKLSKAESKGIVLQARRILSKKVLSADPALPSAEPATAPGFSMQSASAPYSYENFYRDFKCIALLDRQFPDVESIIEQLTRIPEIPDPIRINEPEKKKPANLVQDLIGHQQTFQIGALIKNLWSALNIPIHHSLPSAQPLGGVSDLSNKGDFDRLLISEFANDDLIFLSRLANQEALYLNREMPPMPDEQERVILLDISLRSWGTPKLLAYAILLAIVHHPRTDIHCTAFALGDSCYPLAFNTVGEVIDCLHILDASQDPAIGLTRFFNEYRNKKKPEIFFVSTPDTIRLPAMQKVISEHREHIQYWVMVGQEGGIELYKTQNKVKKLVQEIRLPLQELWKPKKREIYFKQPEETIPARDIPILFPPSGAVKKIVYLCRQSIFLITKDQHLYRADSDIDKWGDRGWELTASGISKSGDYELGRNKEGQLVLLCFNRNKKEISLRNLTSGINHSLLFPEWTSSIYKDFFWRKDAFYYLKQDDGWKIDYDAQLAIQKQEPAAVQEMKEFYKLRERNLTEMLAKIGERSSRKAFNQVLKKVEAVFINGAGNLVFNKHELVLESNGMLHLTLASPEGKIPVLSAQWNPVGNNFVFPGGSSVTLNRGGVLILKNGQPALPGQSGQTARYNVVLHGNGPNILHVIKVIRENTGLGLGESRNLAERAPSVVKAGLTLSQAEALSKALTDQDADVEITLTERIVFIPTTLQSALGVATPAQFAGNEFYYSTHCNPAMDKMNMKEFYQAHILTFIKQIQSYGT
jgi:ribosomal protein L7/L12